MTAKFLNQTMSQIHRDLVNLAQPPTRPPSPGLPASGSTLQRSQSVRPLSPPIAPPWAPRSSNTPLPDGDCSVTAPHTLTRSAPQRYENKDNHKLDLHMETSMRYSYICAKKFQIPSKKQCLQPKGINGLRCQLKNSRA